jgi:hypothetical protein
MKEGVSTKSYRGRNLIVANLYLAVADFHSLTIRVTIKDILHCNRSKK